MKGLVLSLFPGIGLLDRAFEEEGFCVVRGPDVLWGGDIRRFHPPAGKFDGIIGGPPCQVHSMASVLRGSKTQKAINLIQEYERCVAEAAPRWFVMENVRNAPIPVVDEYAVWSRLINNRWFGAEQRRRRRFSFGVRGEAVVPLHLEPAVFLNPIEKRTVLASDGKRNGQGNNLPDRLHTSSAQRQTFTEACELQGLPGDFLADAPFTKHGRWLVVGNGVPLPMGRAIARAVARAVGEVKR